MNRYLILVLLLLSVAAGYSQTWREYHALYTDYYNRQIYDSAMVFLNKAVSDCEDRDATSDTTYVVMISELGNLYGLMKMHNECIETITKANKLIIKNQGKNSLYAENCLVLAGIYSSMGDYPASEKQLKESLDVLEKIFGNQSPQYLRCYIELPRLYVKMRKLGDADGMYEEGRKNAEKIYGKKSNQYLNLCSEEGVYLKKRRKYTESEILLKECVDLREEIAGPSDTAYASDCENLAMLYDKMGKYADAEVLMVQCLNIRKPALGEKHPAYLQAVENLGAVYKNSGQYARAEPYYIELKETAESMYGNADTVYADRCNALGLLYAAMGNYKNAEPLYFEAKAIREAVNGNTHPEYAKIINNIATLYIKLFDYEAAKPLLTESLEIKKKTEGPETASYANSCNNLAYVYMNTGEFNSAEKLFKEALKINESRFGKAHINYLKAGNNLGNLYIEMKSYNAAEKILLEIKEIASQKLGVTHPYYAEICNNLAKLYRLKGEVSQAKSAYLETMSTANTIISNNFGLLTEQEKEMYFAGFDKFYDGFNAFSLQTVSNDPAIAEYVFNNTIKTKGMLLKSSTALRFSILSSNDSVLLAKYDNWMLLKRQISDLYAQPVYERGNELTRLEGEANTLEKQLIKESELFADSENEKKLTWTDIKSNLKPNEAAIEFIDFQDGDSVIYCALIVRQNSKYPEMIRLFEEKQLQQIFGKFLMNNVKYINSLYGQQNQANTKLYNLIWKPIEEKLEGCTDVYISPSGLLHKISFPALCREQNVFLCDVYDINMSGSTTGIIRPRSHPITDIHAFVVGGVEYNTEVTDNNVWAYLPGTKEEADSITGIMQQGQTEFNYQSNRKASELVFKQDATGYNVLHISTHGFFYPDPEELLHSRIQKQEKPDEETRASANGDWGFGMYAFAMNRNPLMRSGLVLAGANNVWNKGAFPQPLVEDGVLTASEVAQLNLINVDLVVLSACETGLGDIRGSEGVYGLQRAFRLAGVDYIIMSLWRVADKETKEFMTCFYQNLLECKDVEIAFTKARSTMRQKYDPYYWAAFVLVE
ncbi:MAG TPA: CHAT domain-containing protein [Bacteroidales bacterium]|nr:CHAT domain-containing protein [Bacteroidales bacterium]